MKIHDDYFSAEYAAAQCISHIEKRGRRCELVDVADVAGFGCLAVKVFGKKHDLRLFLFEKDEDDDHPINYTVTEKAIGGN
jgi:hypothetical protein